MARLYSIDTDGGLARVESDYSAEGTSVVPGNNYLYGAQGTNLYRTPLSSISWELVADLGFTIAAVAIDSAAGYVFCTGAGQPVNRRALDGSGSTNIVASNPTGTALALSRSDARVFYRGASSTILHADYDGGDPELVHTESSLNWYYDEENDWLYFLRGSGGVSIRRVRMAGTVAGFEVLGNMPSTVFASTPAFAPALGSEGTLFMASDLGAGDTMWRLDVGAFAVTEIQGDLRDFSAFAWHPDEARLYASVTTEAESKLVRMNADGSGVEVVGAVPNDAALVALAFATV